MAGTESDRPAKRYKALMQAVVLIARKDDTGFWQMSIEDDDGTLTLISHQFSSPDHLIEDGRELVETGRVPGAAIVIGPPRDRQLARSAA